MKNKVLYNVLVALCCVFMAIGLYVVIRVFMDGQGALFHSDDNLPWTLLIASYIFFVLMSTGITLVAALPSVFGLKQYEPIVKRAIFIALVSLVAGFISMGIELGSPLNMYNYLLTPNFSSPIWWMGLFYASLMVILSVKFYGLHTGKIKEKTAKRLAIAAFVIELLALSTLGAVFGVIEARHIFFGEYIQIYFLFSAILCGLAALIFFNMLYFRFSKNEMPVFLKSTMTDFGKMIGVVLGLILIFSIWRAAISLYANRTDYRVIQYMIHSWPYKVEIVAGILIPLFMIMSKQLRNNLNALVLASVLVLFGMGIGRMDLVMAGQLLPGMASGLNSDTALIYFPTIWEWFAGLFSLAFMLLAILLGERFLNLNMKSEVQA